MILGDTYPDLRRLHYRLVHQIGASNRGSTVLDDVRGSAAISLNNLVFATSCDFERFDLGHVGFTEHRWRRFLREYVNAEQFHSWVQQAPQTRRNGAELVFLANQIGRKVTVKLNETSDHLYGGHHRWGNCLLGMVFGVKPYPRLTMHSRTSALTRGGVLDLTLASIAGREMAQVLGISQAEIKFCWMAASLQVSCWQLMPLATAWGHIEWFISKGTPTGNGLKRYMEKGRFYNYASSRRAGERADQIAAGEMPVTRVRDLEVPQ